MTLHRVVFLSFECASLNCCASSLQEDVDSPSRLTDGTCCDWPGEQP